MKKSQTTVSAHQTGTSKASSTSTTKDKVAKETLKKAKSKRYVVGVPCFNYGY